MSLTRSQLTTTEWNPVVFMNGDDSTRRGADMVKDIVFSDFNYIDADTGVEARVASNDECIDIAAKLLKEHRAGIKISTASNDPQIRERGWKSANIVLRPKAGVVGMYRQTMAPGNYKRPVAVMRCGTGDFYVETSCRPITTKDGLEAREIIQEFVIAYLEPFARAAAERARQNELQMILSSKWTISEGETYIPDICERVFAELGLKAGENRGEGDHYREIADMAGAYIPTNVGPAGNCAMSMDNGGWMIVCGNANGDTFADIADLQHGGNSMGSECICDGFSYFELPGGTAPGRKDSDFKGAKFFSPMGTLVSFGGAIASVNAEAQAYVNAVMAAASKYMAETDPSERCTQTMLEQTASSARGALPE